MPTSPRHPGMTTVFRRADVGIGPYDGCRVMGVGTPLRGVRKVPASTEVRSNGHRRSSYRCGAVMTAPYGVFKDPPFP